MGEPVPYTRGPALDGELKRLRETMTNVQLEAHFGLSELALRAWVRGLGLIRPKRNPRQHPLAPIILQRWNDGLSVERIYAELGEGGVHGLSVSAFIALARRIGLPRRPRAAPPNTKAKKAKAPADRDDAADDDAEAGPARRPNLGGMQALPAGHPVTWNILTQGTLLEGVPYPK